MLRIAICCMYFLFFIWGCDDAGIVSPSDIRGILLNERGIPVQNARVMAGGSETVSQADGSFVLTVNQSRYDIMVFKQGQPDIGYLYKDISLREPIVTLFESEGSYYSSELTVTIPAMSGLERAIVIFTNFISIQEHAFITQPGVSVQMNVPWAGIDRISGKVIVIVFKLAGGSVVSYERYGEKDVTLINNSPQNIGFSSQDLSFNPEEANVGGSLSVPPGSTSPRADLIFNFVSGSLILPFTAGSPIGYVDGVHFNFVVPQNLPSNLRLVVGGSASGDKLQEFSTKTLVTEIWSSNNFITLENFPELLEPVNNAINVNINTNFRADGIRGVKVFRFDGNDRLFYVITNQNQTTIPDFSNFGLTIGYNHEYEWSLFSYGEADVNEFVKTGFTANPLLVFFTVSSRRNFTTGP